MRSIEAYPPRDDKVIDLPPDQTDSSKDAEKQIMKGPIAIDIEHLPVDDDPREWSNRKKWTVLMIMTFAMVSTCQQAPLRRTQNIDRVVAP